MSHCQENNRDFLPGGYFPTIAFRYQAEKVLAFFVEPE
jgi:hypothetical protein